MNICHWPSAIFALTVLHRELAKRRDSLVDVESPVLPPPSGSASGGHHGTKVSHHPRPRTLGNWCLPWYVHTHNGAIHRGEILSRDVGTTINYHWIILAIS